VGSKGTKKIQEHAVVMTTESQGLCSRREYQKQNMWRALGKELKKILQPNLPNPEFNL